MPKARPRVAEGRPAKVTEAHVLRAVRKYLRDCGWLVIRFQQGLGCHRGLADLGALRDGRWVFVECKSPTGRLSPAQEEFRRQVESRGGTYIVARGVEDVAELGSLRFLWTVDGDASQGDDVPGGVE